VGTFFAIAVRDANRQFAAALVARDGAGRIPNIVYEVLMSGRRSHPRFAVATPWLGAIRILRDVVVNRTGDDELLVVSNAAAVVGEVLSLELMGGGQSVMVKVCVRDSRPVIIDGTVRHRVRLGLIDLQSAATLPEDAVADPLAIESTIQRVAEAG